MRLWCYLIELKESSLLVGGGGGSNKYFLYLVWDSPHPEDSRQGKSSPHPGGITAVFSGGQDGPSPGFLIPPENVLERPLILICYKMKSSLRWSVHLLATEIGRQFGYHPNFELKSELKVI